MANFAKSGRPKNFSNDSLKIAEIIANELKSDGIWNETLRVQKVGSQKCSDMLIMSEWRGGKSIKLKTFQESWKGWNDFGYCCTISPYLDFENEETSKLNGSEYKPNDWYINPSFKNLTKSGTRNGIRLLLDVELFEHELPELVKLAINAHNC